MTADRIDHAAEAQVWIDRIPDDDPGWARACATAANAEATLALVEQQRIANLIALSGLPTLGGPVSDYADELRNAALVTLAHYELRPPDDEDIVIDPDIAAALGVEA